MILKGKTFFITGASRGIGLAIALAAARQGANIVIAAKTVDPHPKLEGTIHTAAQQIEGAGGNALAVACDIRSEEQIQHAIDAGVSQFGGLDVCINNASAIDLASSEDLQIKKYDLIQAVNVRGSFLVSRACVPHLRKAANPHVLNLAPPLQFRPEWAAPYPAYALSKYAMSFNAMAMAAEFANDGIAFNTLWPKTLIATAAVANVVANSKALARSRKPTIMADAALSILARPSKICTGRHFIDEDVLIADGVVDLRHYRFEPGDSPLETDLFVDPTPPPSHILT